MRRSTCFLASLQFISNTAKLEFAWRLSVASILVEKLIVLRMRSLTLGSPVGVEHQEVRFTIGVDIRKFDSLALCAKLSGKLCGACLKRYIYLDLSCRLAVYRGSSRSKNFANELRRLNAA